MGKPPTSTLEKEKLGSPERNLEWLALLYYKKSYTDRNMVLFSWRITPTHSSTPNTPQGRTNSVNAPPSVGRRDERFFPRATGVDNARRSMQAPRVP